MAQREMFTARIDPLVARAIETQAKDSGQSEGWVIEWLAKQVLGHRLPLGWEPGQKVAGAEGGVNEN
jgi:hypothetical protein